MDGFLGKPLDLRQLREVLMQCRPVAEREGTAK